MKIILAGGSGQVGTMLARAFTRDGHNVIVLSRTPHPSPWPTAQWDFKDIASWSHHLDGADVVINLAGRSVNCRYNEANRREIIESRVKSVHALGEAIAFVSDPPRVWLQASTATIYAHTYGAPKDELGTLGGAEPDAPDTWRFSIDVAKQWEQALDEVEVPNTRKVTLRSAMTMSPDKGGVFDTLLRLVRLGLGGTSGNGNQFVSWIHEQDFVRAIYFLIENPDVSGVVNLSSPNPLPNREFMARLREAWGTSIGLPAFEWMLEIGAVFLLTETELILKSRRVIPGRLIASGFTFEFPTWKLASEDLVKQWRRSNATEK